MLLGHGLVRAKGLHRREEMTRFDARTFREVTEPAPLRSGLMTAGVRGRAALPEAARLLHVRTAILVAAELPHQEGGFRAASGARAATRASIGAAGVTTCDEWIWRRWTRWVGAPWTPAGHSVTVLQRSCNRRGAHRR